MKQFFTELSKREIVFIIMIVILAAATGGFAWTVARDDAQTKIDSFDSCAAAGNPIREIYPEQCVANGETYTKAYPVEETIDTPSVDQSDAWMLFTSPKRTYSVRVPDGWELLQLLQTENVYGGKLGPLVLAEGTRGSVVTTEGGWDGASVFALYVPEKGYETQIVKEGTKIDTFVTAQGKTAEKYEFEQTEDPEGIGYEKGQKVINYYFGADAAHIQVQHVYGLEQQDLTAIVEKMLKTLTVPGI